MKSLFTVISGMHGGGAERVISCLANGFKTREYDVEMIVTSDKSESIIRGVLDDGIGVNSLQDNIIRKTGFLHRLKGMCIRGMCKAFETFKFAAPATLAYHSFKYEYGEEIGLMRKKLQENPDASVIAFLQPAIPITLLAAKGLSNRIIISERGDPKRLMKHRYGEKFITKYYTRADKIVFQTEDALNTYPEDLREKGSVIFNPISSNLPEPYHGPRRKVINTFCRISRQKNLPLLIEAFALFRKEHTDYKLHIIGNPNNESDNEVMVYLKKQVAEKNLTDSVLFLPFSSDVHKMIIQDSIYVNSSDYEGMSNSMLEAMTIGLPVICTDCPIGGARAVIQDRENGILVPVGDVSALAEAICELVDDKELSEKFSLYATELREKLDIRHIADEWMALL